VRDVVLQERRADRDVAQARVERFETLLRSDADRNPGNACAARAMPSSINVRPSPTPRYADVVSTRPDRRLGEFAPGIDQPQIAGEGAPASGVIPPQQMPRVEIEAVGILECATLLDGEHFLPRGEHRVDIGGGELGQARPLPIERELRAGSAVADCGMARTVAHRARAVERASCAELAAQPDCFVIPAASLDPRDARVSLH
jgi:hypothetical protein